MDDLTADGLIANFSWGREEIHPSDYGRAPDSPTVWAGMERPAPVVGLQVGDYSVPVTLGEDGAKGAAATPRLCRLGSHRRKAGSTDQRGSERSDTSAGRSGPSRTRAPGRPHVE
jgi:hypothetical protein